MFRIIGVVALSVFLASSGSKAQPAKPKPVVMPEAGASVCDGAQSHGKLVVITIDGTRWQEIYTGTEDKRWETPHAHISAADLTPNLHALGRRGAMIGAPDHGTISASGPNFISFPGYTEMFSGHISPCQSNNCPRNVRTTIFDEAWVGGSQVAVFTSWKKIDFAATTMENSFFRSCSDEDHEGRPDEVTGAAALAYYEEQKPDVFYFGMAETDTAAHQNDYDLYIQKLQEADAMIGQLVALTDPDTHIIVTADHGRSYNFRDHASPDAARVWMVAAGPRIPAHGEVYSPQPRHLADLAATSRAILGLPADTTEGGGKVLDEIFQVNASDAP